MSNEARGSSPYNSVVFSKPGSGMSFVQEAQHHVPFVAQSGPARSMLDDLTPTETAELMAWSEQQPRTPAGAIDMMAWPGWAAVMGRRFKEKFGVDPTAPAE
ncbi:hypothetical protein J1C51_23615 [Chromobacterium haemolyticum]|uniref:hypothetical protein n=1 Tax=Chromobacterium haemolyticum TaxID=394935 RepID=UPI001A929D1A|nr:hypothetical protein [Chromobacterium haemolyticum]MBO0501766.1 hypothetical protein [Chromobacterium haemolyticum]